MGQWKETWLLFVTTKLSSVYTGRYPLKSGNEHTIHEHTLSYRVCPWQSPRPTFAISVYWKSKRVRLDDRISCVRWCALRTWECNLPASNSTIVLLLTFCVHFLLDVLKFTRNEETMVASYHIARSMPPYCCLLAITRIPWIFLYKNTRLFVVLSFIRLLLSLTFSLLCNAFVFPTFRSTRIIIIRKYRIIE